MRFIGLLLVVSILAIIVFGVGLAVWARETHQLGVVNAAAASPYASVPGFIIDVLGQTFWEAALVIAILSGMPRLTNLSLRDLGFRGIDARSLGCALIGALAMVLIADLGSSLIASFTHATHPQFIQQMFERLRSRPPVLTFFIIFGAVFAPSLEEVVFRIFVFNLGLRYGGFWIGAIGSSALFGLAHILGRASDVFTGGLLALSGIVLCWVYYRTRNAYASIISHVLFNVFAILLFYFAPGFW